MKLSASLLVVCAALAGGAREAGAAPAPGHPLVLHAARLLEVDTGRVLSPGELLVDGGFIIAAGSAVARPAGAEIVDLGDTTLLPGLIDAHVHLFLHPGDEAAQTLRESVAQRTILATRAAEADLLAGFTAERDMGTEGAGSADTAVRDAIDAGLIRGPRLRISGNALSILGGHEDAAGYNPDQHILPNATYANNSDELVAAIRAQHREGADFVKIYETGADRMTGGALQTPYQYTTAQLRAAVDEAARLGARVAVHAVGEPGARYAVEAGVASIDHALQLSDATMTLMKQKHIPAVPTFTIYEFFAPPPGAPDPGQDRAQLDYKIREFRRQLAAGIPFAVGSDVGPFPHGTQAREFELLVRYGMTPLAALQADLVNGARLLGWEGQIGALKPGYFADIIAVPGNPLEDIHVLSEVVFVMKGGVIEKRASR